VAAPGGVGAPNWPTPITLMDTSQNPPGVSCLVHSGQVAKQHESSFLYDKYGLIFLPLFDVSQVDIMLDSLCTR